jgi:hypothetical protein
MIISDALYRGLPPTTYATDQGDKVMGEDIISSATPDELRKELQHYLSVDKAHRSWVTVTNVINLHTRLRNHSTLENLTALEMVSLSQVIKIQPVDDHALRESPALDLVTYKKKRMCEIL